MQHFPWQWLKPTRKRNVFGVFAFTTAIYIWLGWGRLLDDLCAMYGKWSSFSSVLVSFSLDDYQLVHRLGTFKQQKIIFLMPAN